MSQFTDRYHSSQQVEHCLTGDMSVNHQALVTRVTTEDTEVVNMLLCCGRLIFSTCTP